MRVPLWTLMNFVTSNQLLANRLPLSLYIYNASRGVIIDTDLIKKCLSQTPAAPDVPPWKPRKYYPAFRG